MSKFTLVLGILMIGLMSCNKGGTDKKDFSIKGLKLGATITEVDSTLMTKGWEPVVNSEGGRFFDDCIYYNLLGGDNNQQLEVCIVNDRVKSYSLIFNQNEDVDAPRYNGHLPEVMKLLTDKATADYGVPTQDTDMIDSIRMDTLMVADASRFIYRKFHKLMWYNADSTGALILMAHIPMDENTNEDKEINCVTLTLNYPNEYKNNDGDISKNVF